MIELPFQLWTRKVEVAVVVGAEADRTGEAFEPISYMSRASSMLGLFRPRRTSSPVTAFLPVISCALRIAPAISIE